MSAPPPEPAGRSRSRPPNLLIAADSTRENVWVTGSLVAGQTDPLAPPRRRGAELITRNGQNGRETHATATRTDRRL